jgi:hypothetical protein
VDPEDGLFNKFSREHRPLSRHLRIYTDQLRSRLNTMQLDHVAELTREDMAQIVDGLRCKPPALGDPVGDWCGPGMPRQYYVAMPILEGKEFLLSWPDETDSIEPIDAHDATAATQWQFGRMPDSPTTPCVFTVIHLTEDEHRQELDQRTLRARFAERVDNAKLVVEALAEQIQRFFDEALVDLGMSIVAARKLNRGIAATLGFPSTWKVPAPKVITESQSPPERTDGPTEVSASQSTSPTTHAPTTGEHVLPYRHRLDPASFEDVQRVTRIWADGIERYPAAFAGLSEDRISDLLAATLNATLPGAQREVYSRGGKSDIFIQADVLAAGSGPAKILICESKWSTTKAWVSEAIDPQLYGYLTAHDTSAILLLLFKQKGFDAARTNACGWLKGVDGYLSEEPGAVDGWPIFVFVRDELTVRVCIASVHVARIGATD